MARDPARIDRVIGALRSLWHLHPDMRLGQLVSNLTHGEDAFNMEDDEMLDLIHGALGTWGRKDDGAHTRTWLLAPDDEVNL